MPRVAVAQRALWQAIRAQLRAEVQGNAETSARTLKAFDELPYHAARGGSRAWLPGPGALRSALTALREDQAQRLVEAARRARVQLQRAVAAAGTVDEAQIDLVADGSLHAVVWRSTLTPTSREEGTLRTAFTLSEPRLQWLRRVHGARRRAEHGAAPNESVFRRDLFRMLAHYDGFAGAGGAGNQAAVPPAVYAALEAWAGAPAGSVIEAFASPLNHRLTCSRQVVCVCVCVCTSLRPRLRVSSVSLLQCEGLSVRAYQHGVQAKKQTDRRLYTHTRTTSQMKTRMCARVLTRTCVCTRCHSTVRRLRT